MQRNAFLKAYETGAATSYNSRGGLSFAHLFSGSTPAHGNDNSQNRIVYHPSYFTFFHVSKGLGYYVVYMKLLNGTVMSYYKSNKAEN